MGTEKFKGGRPTTAGKLQAEGGRRHQNGKVCSSLLAPRPARRGVLLLVVLSMLVLFMLIGTAFLMTASQSRVAAKTGAKLDRVGTYGTKDLDRALLQVIRDTNSGAGVALSTPTGPALNAYESGHSAIRTHSLLNDLYGTGGLEACVYNPPNGNLSSAAEQTSRYAGAGTLSDLGPTQGQLIDIYVRALGWNPSPPTSEDDPLTSASETTGAGRLVQPDARHVLKLERSVLGLPQVHTLSLVKGYYNGCILTMTSGPAAGQSTRIVDYEYIGDLPSGSVPTRLFRFRVLAFPTKDGSPLLTRSQLATTNVKYSALSARGHELCDLVFEKQVGSNVDRGGHTFVVNGRPFSGTGVGFNPLATEGSPRLSATQIINDGTNQWPTEIALTPNANYLDFSKIPFLNIAPTPTAWLYQSYSGPGGANESYDAADFQNMLLALQTVSPRARGRVVHNSGGTPIWYDTSDPMAVSGAPNFLRFDLEDVTWPSFHRPDLVNYWYHWLFSKLTQAPYNLSEDEAVKAIYDPNTYASNPAAASLITQIKRKIMLRPLRDDHPNFDGGNPQFAPPALGRANNLVLVTPNGPQIAIPTPEITGPWDVDNDNDRVADSVWVDIGNPVMEAEDGTRYKALVAYLIVDMDSRLNVNTHGLVEHLLPPNGAMSTSLDPTFQSPGNLANGASSNFLPQGLGWGAAEISLRPVMPFPWLNTSGQINLTAQPNRVEGNFPVDSYATLLGGRFREDGTALSGKWGINLVNPVQPGDAVAPGTNYRFQAIPQDPSWPMTWTGESAIPDGWAMIKFFDYPSVFGNLATNNMNGSAFRSAPDLKARYALGISFGGQPSYEGSYDGNPANNNLPYNLLANTAYEIDLSNTQRRDTWALDMPNANAVFNQSLSQNDDAPFATADLERILRRGDSDAGTLESRLYDVVDVFDPDKLIEFDNFRVQAIANAALGGTAEPEMIAAAESIAAVNSRLVTTDSFSLPVPGGNFLGRLIYGPDGQPGRAGIDDNNANGPDDPDEYGWAGSDDWHFVMALTTAEGGTADYNTQGQPTTPVTRPQSGSLIDLLMYRIQYERVKAGLLRLTDAQLMLAAEQLLSRDVIAGKRMDINRPFGDGRDNNGNGVVDEPFEAGEPFLDANGNGRWDPGEKFIDIDGDGNYSRPGDKLWNDLFAAGMLGEQIEFDYTNGQGVPLHPTAATAASVNVNTAVVRNLESQGRQLYARQLYCLMLLLMDENYVAPLDANADLTKGDPQIVRYATTLKAAPYNLSVDQIKRKLTCRAIAQWAINCVDARDADAIMTPFEYDENPWDGWGCLGRNGNLIPIDGDPATDENGDLTSGTAAVLDWSTIGAGGRKATMNVPAPANALHQTRGIVWGAERPELLINETVAWHDRRTTGPVEPPDPTQPPQNNQPQMLKQRLKPQGSVFVEIMNPWTNEGAKPAELYRYSGNIAHGPAIGQSYIDPQTGAAVGEGVLLHRLSDLTGEMLVNNLARRPEVPEDPTPIPAGNSPVWRLAVVRQSKPQLVGPDPNDDTNPEVAVYGNITGKYQASQLDVRDGWAGDKNRPAGAAKFRRLNPDLADFDSDRDAERWVYFAREPNRQLYTYGYNSITQKWKWFEGTPSATAGPPLRIPSVPAYFNVEDGDRWPLGRQYFLAFNKMDPAPRATGDVFSPILPGHYAVIGSAGTQVPDMEQTTRTRGYPEAPRFITTVGRVVMPSSQTETDPEDLHKKNLLEGAVRRIELLPQPNPLLQQILIAKNGGPEWVMRLRNGNNEMVNVADPASYAPGTIAPVNPAAAFPIAGFNISEPVEGYVHTFELGQYTDRKGKAFAAYREAHRGNPDPEANITGERTLKENLFSGELEFVGESDGNQQDPGAYFKIPLDIDFDLVRNGTTANYRTIHLQRLANPQLPWNPLPRLSDGNPHPDYNPALPVNPYLTIDSAGVDCTAMNGADISERTALGGGNSQTAGSSLEKTDTPDYGNRTQWHAIPRHLPWPDTIDGVQQAAGQFKQRFHLKSLERGSHQISVVKPQPGNIPRAARTLWDQERENRKSPLVGEDQGPHFDGDNYPYPAPDVVDHNYALTGSANSYWLRFNPNPLTPTPQRRTAMTPMETPTSGDLVDVLSTDERRHQLATDARIPQPVVDNMLPLPSTEVHVVDYVLEQTLGFPNVAQGPLNLNGVAGVIPQSVGTPQINRPAANTDKRDDSTFPWLAWNDRPFVSAEELLNVPVASSAMLLKSGYYSTVNPNEPLTVDNNPYGNDGTDTTNPTDTFRANFPFGHLLSFFAAETKRQSGVAPHFYRILDYLQVPSRFVGTDTMLSAEIFNDVPNTVDPIGADFKVVSPASPEPDPRMNFQPPFNKVSRERDPGRVNINTVTSRRIQGTTSTPPFIWSDVYDGIMHRHRHPATGAGDWDYRDKNIPYNLVQLSHPGPAWRDVVLSRKGYVQFDAAGNSVDKPLGTNPNSYPDVSPMGLNNNFPTVFANPFRTADAGDLVPIADMVQNSVDATMMRRHPYKREGDGWGPLPPVFAEFAFGDIRDAGFGNDVPSFTGKGTLPDKDFATGPDMVPLFSETRADAFSDTDRNPYMKYQPLTRIGNLVTNRSNVFAVWITVGYFEVEPAPNWSLNENNVQARFGGDEALYNRVYPDGYMLGRELGSDTGNIKRPRGFYILDRSVPVGFKPGEDLNVEKMIRVRRRIE